MMSIALSILGCLGLASAVESELAPAVVPSMANLPVQVPLPFPSDSSMAALLPSNGTNGVIEGVEKQMLQFIRNMRKSPAEMMSGEKGFNFLQGDAHSNTTSLIQGTKPQFWPFWWGAYIANAKAPTAATPDKMASLASMHNDYMAYSYIWMVMCNMIDQGLTAGGFMPKTPDALKQGQGAPGFPPYAAGAWPYAAAGLAPYPSASTRSFEKKILSSKRLNSVTHFHQKSADPWDTTNDEKEENAESMPMFLQKEAGAFGNAMDLPTVAKHFKVAGIYWDMSANLNIMACMGYQFPAAVKAVSVPMTHTTDPTIYVNYVKLVSFYYWAGVQYWVDILNIYDIYTPAEKKASYGPWIDWSNKYALRCKSYAFYMYGYHNAYLAAKAFKAPIAKTDTAILGAVKQLLHIRSQNLVMTVLSFSYQNEFHIPASKVYANSYSNPMVLEFAYNQLILGFATASSS